MDDAIFDANVFLATEGPDRTLIRRTAKQPFFHQGTPADAVFYLHSGRAKLSVISKRGKEATVTLLSAGDFFGEESMVSADAFRTSTATATSPCRVLKISRSLMLQTLQLEPLYSRFFLQFVLRRGIRTHSDLVDQLFNSSQRRLARTLLLMAGFGQPGDPISVIPAVTQETLAQIIGTTRSRVSFFMKRFRKLGYIRYNGRIHVNKSLLNMVLHDNLPEENATRPRLLDPPPGKARTARRSPLNSA